MVLVDTSVWIQFLSSRLANWAEFDRLLAAGQVAGHELVYGELLIGDRGGRRKLLARYRDIHQAAAVPHWEVVEFVLVRGFDGRGVGWIDVHLLASAVAGHLRLWTVNPRLHELAGELGVAYRIPRRRINGHPDS